MNERAKCKALNDGQPPSIGGGARLEAGSPKKAIWRGWVLQTPAAPHLFLSDGARQGSQIPDRETQTQTTTYWQNVCRAFLFVRAAAGGTGRSTTLSGERGAPGESRASDGASCGERAGARFTWGFNWTRFARVFRERGHIRQAERSCKIARIFPGEKHFAEALTSSQIPGQKPQAPRKHLLAGGATPTTTEILNGCQSDGARLLECAGIPEASEAGVCHDLAPGSASSSARFLTGQDPASFQGLVCNPRSR